MNERKINNRYPTIKLILVIGVISIGIISLFYLQKSLYKPNVELVELKVDEPSIVAHGYKNDFEDDSDPAPSILNYVTKGEIDFLCQLVYGEGRGLNKTEMSAIVWCVLNRVDSSKFPNTVDEVLLQPGQFYSKRLSFPIEDYIYELVIDVLTRWGLEKQGITEVGRTLPKSYVFYFGDGKHNYYRETYKSSSYYNWNLKSPYK